MHILALIPARGGSKRIPRKNIRMLGGLPLIAWTIRAAQESAVCADILVSSDDPEIAAIAQDFGASMQGFRPSDLATDTATSVAVTLFELEKYEQTNGPVDGLLLLQPTSPFRSAASIRRAVELFRPNGRPVVSMSPAKNHPAWCFRIHENASGNELEPCLGWSGLEKRSQDLEPAYALNGSIYLIAPHMLRSEQRFVTPSAQALIIDAEKETLDIDTEEDWLRAEFLLMRHGACESENSHNRHR